MAGQVAQLPSSPPAAAADANLLFGVLALQMDFVGRDQLIAGMQAWIHEKSKSLADHLVGLGALRPERRRLLEPLVAEHVRQHQGDLSKSLAATDFLNDIQSELDQIDDPDVQRSIQSIPRAQPVAPAASINATCLQDSLPSDSMRFRILRPHARGGLGEVFVAKDTELGREVALKEIQLDKSDDLEARTRFIREAEITGGLEHPGVVPVYSLGAYPDGRPFYAMRFIRGQTLHDAIKAFHAPPEAGQPPATAAQKNLELRRLLQRFIDVCEAIDYAHSRGVLHRDLKPGNIMLGRYGETLVVDWGLAKAGGESTARPKEATRSSAHEPVQFAEPQLSPSASHESTPTQMGFVPGTPAYMSPEHALGRIDLMGPASDVFSLGATLYHLLTGRPPYVGKDVKEVQQQAQTGSYPLPSAIAQVPKPLEAVCCKALAVSPSERYPNTSSLAADIERYLGDEPVSAYREPLRTRVARWMRRHSRLVAIAVICFLIIPICLGSGLFVALQQQHLARAAEDQAEVGLLCAATSLAHHALQAGDHPTAARALKRVPLDRRSWVYEYLFQQLAFHGVVEGEAGGITCLAVQPNGEQLAYGTRSGEVCLRDARSGREILRTKVSTEPQSVVAMAWSTSATQLAVASGNMVQIYNATTLAPVQRVPLNAPIVGVAFSPDDRQLLAVLPGNGKEIPWPETPSRAAGDRVSGYEARIIALGVGNGSVEWSGSIPRCERPCVCYASRSTLILGAGNKISVLDPADGTEQRDWSLERGDEVESLLCTPDGEQLIVGTRQGIAEVYEIASGQLVRRLDQVISSVVGAKLLAQGEGPAVWIDQHAAIVGSMALRDSDDIVLISLAGDVWIVNHHTGTIRKQLIHKGVLTAAGSNGGPLIAMADQDEVFVFNATHALRELSRQTRVFPAAASYPALSPDGKLVLFAMQDEAAPGASIIVAHDIDAAAVRWTAKAQFPHFFGFSPDGSRVVALCDDIKVFDSQSGACLMESPKLVFPSRNGQSTAWQSSIQSAVVDAANRYVAIDGDALQVWEIATGQKVAESPRLGASSLQLSAEGDVLLGHVDDSVRSWRFSDLKEVTRLKGASTGDLMGITRDNNIIERNGHQLIARSWPAKQAICDFEHDGPTLCIDFHPTCRRVVTGGADGKLNIWQYPSGEKLLELPFSRTVAAVRFSLDGSRLIAIDRDGKVGIWDSKPASVDVQP